MKQCVPTYGVHIIAIGMGALGLSLYVFNNVTYVIHAARYLAWMCMVMGILLLTCLVALGAIYCVHGARTAAVVKAMGKSWCQSLRIRT